MLSKGYKFMNTPKQESYNLALEIARAFVHLESVEHNAARISTHILPYMECVEMLQTISNYCDGDLCCNAQDIRNIKGMAQEALSKS